MIIVDIETSGLDILKCGIWQIGAIEFENPKNQFLEEARIDDEDTIEEDSIKVTGKAEKELRDKKKQSQKQLIENFFKWCEKRKVKTLICQNPQFDFSMIDAKARKYNLKPPFHHRAFDLHSIAQIKYFQLNSKFLIDKERSDMGLSNILNLCGMRDERRKIEEGVVVKEGKEHNALEDAKLTAECFSRIINGKNLLSRFRNFKIPEYMTT